jgi:hypothetical protein
MAMAVPVRLMAGLNGAWQAVRGGKWCPLAQADALNAGCLCGFGKIGAGKLAHFR